MNYTLLLIGAGTGLAGLVLIIWYPIKDAYLSYQAKRIMGDMVVSKRKPVDIDEDRW